MTGVPNILQEKKLFEEAVLVAVECGLLGFRVSKQPEGKEYAWFHSEDHLQGEATAEYWVRLMCYAFDDPRPVMWTLHCIVSTVVPTPHDDQHPVARFWTKIKSMKKRLMGISSTHLADWDDNET